ERWEETLVSSYVRNGRYSPTRPLWRPPRPPTPHRAMPSSEEEAVVAASDEYAECDEPVVIVDSDEEYGEKIAIGDSEEAQEEVIVISDSEEEEMTEPSR
ncbi:hypothetical protein AWZ03_015457, partial [Drosophila navojoa]